MKHNRASATVPSIYMYEQPPNKPPTAHALGHPIRALASLFLQPVHPILWYAHTFCVVPATPPPHSPTPKPNSLIADAAGCCCRPPPFRSWTFCALLPSQFLIPLPFEAAALASVLLFNCAASLHVYHMFYHTFQVCTEKNMEKISILSCYL